MVAGRRSGLGRGLDALLGSAASASVPAGHARTESEAAHAGGVLEVELGRIEPNPRQPRRQLEPAALEALAASIREHGVLQPLVVTRLESAAGGERYRLIAGERRWAAAKLAGLVRVPVVVREASPRELLELALVENVQRADLNPLEEAAAYQQLIEEFGLTQEEIGRRVGKSRFAIANTLRLLNASAAVQQAVLDGELTEGHARAILGLRDKEAQRRVVAQVIEHGLSVRATEELVRRLQEPAPAAIQRRAGRARRPPELEELEERLRAALGTKVSLTRSKRGGRLSIFFYDDEQLQSLLDRLVGA